MQDSVKAIELLMSDFNQFVSDGASNAIGSIAEFESQTREERSNDISVQRCVSHNNELSLGYASGLLDYTDRVNEELGDILNSCIPRRSVLAALEIECWYIELSRIRKEETQPWFLSRATTLDGTVGKLKWVVF